MSLIRRKSPWHCACARAEDERRHLLCPRNYLQLVKSERAFFSVSDELTGLGHCWSFRNHPRHICCLPRTSRRGCNRGKSRYDILPASSSSDDDITVPENMVLVDIGAECGAGIRGCLQQNKEA